MESTRAEDLIESLSSMKEALASLLSAYSRLPRLFERENAAILEMNMAVVEEIVAEKVLLSDGVAQATAAIGDAFDRLGQGSASPSAAKGFAARLDAMSEGIPPGLKEGFAGQLIDHLTGECRRMHAEFRSLHAKAEPSFGVHREVAAKRIAQFRESYRFWLGVEQELNGGYDRQGHKTEGNAGSLIQTRA